MRKNIIIGPHIMFKVYMKYLRMEIFNLMGNDIKKYLYLLIRQ